MMNSQVKLTLWYEHREESGGCQGGGGWGRDGEGGWDEQMQTIIYKTDKQQGPIA